MGQINSNNLNNILPTQNINSFPFSNFLSQPQNINFNNSSTQPTNNLNNILPTQNINSFPFSNFLNQPQNINFGKSSTQPTNNFFNVQQTTRLNSIPSNLDFVNMNAGPLPFFNSQNVSNNYADDDELKLINSPFISYFI